MPENGYPVVTLADKWAIRLGKDDEEPRFGTEEPSALWIEQENKTSGSSEAWYRARFGTERSRVRIPPSRPVLYCIGHKCEQRRPFVNVRLPLGDFRLSKFYESRRRPERRRCLLTPPTSLEIRQPSSPKRSRIGATCGDSATNRSLWFLQLSNRAKTPPRVVRTSSALLPALVSEA